MQNIINAQSSVLPLVIIFVIFSLLLLHMTQLNKEQRDAFCPSKNKNKKTFTTSTILDE